MSGFIFCQCAKPCLITNTLYLNKPNKCQNKALLRVPNSANVCINNTALINILRVVIDYPNYPPLSLIDNAVIF